MTIRLYTVFTFIWCGLALYATYLGEWGWAVWNILLALLNAYIVNDAIKKAKK